MLLQFDLKHILKVNFYPSDNNFTQALLVMLVTNMISDSYLLSKVAITPCVIDPVQCDQKAIK